MNLIFDYCRDDKEEEDAAADASKNVEVLSRGDISQLRVLMQELTGPGGGEGGNNGGEDLLDLFDEATEV